MMFGCVKIVHQFRESLFIVSFNQVDVFETGLAQNYCYSLTI